MLNKTLNIACILDTFSFNVFKYEANLIALSPNHWLDEMKNIRIDILFVESAWRGKDDLWDEKINKTSPELIQLVQYCKKNKIPTIFWNKEDPYHFKDFIDSVKLFDYVFTTDILCIPKYLKVLNHNNVFFLPFGCQPKIHNPIEKHQRKEAFVFAGAYYKRFKERNKNFSKMVDILKDIGKIDIFDRNYNKNTIFQYPQKYHQYIRGGLEYDEIDKAYKGYKYAINLNSITRSPSMFSRRVFELMASNTIVVSNDSLGMRFLLGDLVLNTKNMDNLYTSLLQMKEDKIFYKKFRLLALRKVLGEHTAKIRLNMILSKVLSSYRENENEIVLCVAYVSKQLDVDNIYDSFLSQTYINKKLLVVCENIDILKVKKTPYISCIDKDEISNYEKDEIKYLSYFNPHHYYGKNYLTDLVNAMQYVDADCISKSGYYHLDKNNTLHLSRSLDSYIYCNNMDIEASIVKIDSNDNINNYISERNKIESKIKFIFAIDEFNFCKDGLLYKIHEKNKKYIDDLEDIDIGEVFSDEWTRKQLLLTNNGLLVKLKKFLTRCT